MKAVFVNPPRSLTMRGDIAPPLWALILGAIAEEEGWSVGLLDLNLETLVGASPADKGMYDWALRRVLNETPRLVALSSMAVNSHVSLELARRIKAAAPSITILLGGPHFGATAIEMIERFQWVDFVAIGEAEHSFRQLVRFLARRRDVTQAWDGFVTRVDGKPVHGGIAHRPSPADVPFPAYHLCELKRYFDLNPRRLFDFDAGRRGCVYDCQFCYAPFHFGRKERRPPIEKFISDLDRAKDLGARHFFFVQDNFVNEPRATVELCREIERARLGITFHCYSTFGQLTDEIIDALAGAGCRGVYVGVDAVDEESQRVYHKRLFTNSVALNEKIDRCVSHDIRLTTAFMLPEPDTSSDRFALTVATALAARLRGATLRFNTLTLYPGTPLYNTYRGRFHSTELKVRLIFDMPEVVCQNGFAEDGTGLFPFHASHRPLESDQHFLFAAHILTTLAKSYPETLHELAQNGQACETIERIIGELCLQELLVLPDAQRRSRELEETYRVFNSIGTTRISRAHFVQEHSALENLSPLANHRESISRLLKQSPRRVVDPQGIDREIAPFDLVTLNPHDGPSQLAVIVAKAGGQNGLLQRELFVQRISPAIGDVLRYYQGAVEQTNVSVSHALWECFKRVRISDNEPEECVP